MHVEQPLVVVHPHLLSHVRGVSTIMYSHVREGFKNPSHKNFWLWGYPPPPGPPRTIFSQKINGKQKNVVFRYRWRFLRAYLNSAGSVDSMGVLVPRECVRMERSEDVTHPEEIHFEGTDMQMRVCCMRNGENTLSKGSSPTPHRIARF